MREEVPTTGTVVINDYNLNLMKRKQIPYFRRTLGIIFQDFRLIPDMKVYDNVAFTLRVTGAKEKDVRTRVYHALGMVGLIAKTSALPQELSGGEQQRVAIARALVNDPKMIIADEPTGNVDPQMSYEIVKLLNDINRNSGTTIVMVTHAHDLVKRFDHRVIALKNGEIIADGYDKNLILSQLKDETETSDTGYYDAPAENKEIDNFIFSYDKGSSDQTDDHIQDDNTEEKENARADSKPKPEFISAEENTADADSDNLYDNSLTGHVIENSKNNLTDLDLDAFMSGTSVAEKLDTNSENNETEQISPETAANKENPAQNYNAPLPNEEKVIESFSFNPKAAEGIDEQEQSEKTEDDDGVNGGDFDE